MHSRCPIPAIPDGSLRNHRNSRASPNGRSGTHPANLIYQVDISRPADRRLGRRALPCPASSGTISAPGPRTRAGRGATRSGPDGSPRPLLSARRRPRPGRSGRLRGWMLSPACGVRACRGQPALLRCFAVNNLLALVSESTRSHAPVVGGYGQRQRVVESLG